MLIERRTVAESATEALRELIVSGELAEGSPVRQQEVAERLGVSRTPLREAITRLTAEGLLRSDPHRGAVVKKPSVKEVREVYEIREALECLAARLAAASVTPQAVERLEAILRAIDRTSSTQEWAELNTKFHMETYRLADREQLWNLISSVRTRSEFYVRMLVVRPDRSDTAQRDHRHILRALEAGDAAAVEEAVRHHLRHTVESLAEDFGPVD